MLLNLYGFVIIGDSAIFAATYGLTFPDTIESQNLFAGKTVVQLTSNRPCLKHRTAPTHHTSGWSNVFTYIVKVLIIVSNLRKRSVWMVISEPVCILICTRKFQCCITKIVQNTWPNLASKGFSNIAACQRTPLSFRPCRRAR